MLELEAQLTLKEVLENDHNVAELLSDEDRSRIGQWAREMYLMDKNSRAEWETNTKNALELAMQITQNKTFPWMGAANIKFPLLTIAGLQYHARAYPSLLPSENFVHCRIIGNDPSGEKTQRAKRVSTHMSYQLSELDTTWEEHTDRALIVQSIIGCAFKKTYFDSFEETPRSTLVFPQDLILDYHTRSIDDCQRMTHVYPMNKNAVIQRQRRGLFLESTELTDDATESAESTDGLKSSQNAEQGIQPPSVTDSTPYPFGEQHCYIDLLGDGYAQPYIVFFRTDNGALARIVPRFIEEDVRMSRDGAKIESIDAHRYFTKLPFVPSPDGGIYDMGFGLLLGATNEAINTILNQLIDAGTMSNTGGGFLPRGVRLMGGDYSFRPNEWKRTDATPEQMKGITPLPVREPSMVLYKLLELLIEFGQKIGMSTDTLTGVSPGQNTPAETSRNTLAQGQKVFNSIYKRTWRALKEEFRKVYKLNQRHVPKSGVWEYPGGQAKASDYYETNKSVIPVANPNIASDTELLQQAMALNQLSATTPGFNRYKVMLRVLDAMKIPNVDDIYPDPKGPNAVPPPVNPKIQLEQMRMQMEEAKIKAQSQTDLMDLMETRRLNTGKILKLQAEAALLLQQAKTEETSKIVAMIDAEIGIAKQQDAHLAGSVERLFKAIELSNDGAETQAKLGEMHANGNRLGGVAQPPRNAGIPQGSVPPQV